MTSYRSVGRTARRHRGVLAVAAAAVLAVAGCSSLLDVKNPNDVPESALNNPAAASALTNGILAAMVRMLAGTTTPYSVATDELDWIGSRDAWNDLETGAVSNYLNEFTDAAFPYAGEARFLGDSNIARLEFFDTSPTVLSKPSRLNLARAYLYTAIVYASIADMYDDFAFSTKQTPAKPIGRANMGTLYDKAIAYLDKAQAIVGPSSDAELKYDVMAYRARVKHGKAAWAKITPKGPTPPASPLVNDAGASADANAAILLGTADKKFLLVDNIEATPGINIWFEVNGRNEHQVGDVYQNLVDPVSGTLDPAVQQLLADFSSDGGPPPGPAGSPTDAGTFTITSTRELRLILAEAALATGDLVGFANQLNQVRALDGKPPWVGTPAAQTMLAYERQAQLWLMRRRLIDMYRFGQKAVEWAPNPNLESAFGTTGLLFPIPNTERLGNPCIEDPSKCP